MRALAYFAVISALALWAGNWIVARSVRDDIAPALITSARAVLVMLCLAPLALPGLRARLRAFNARDWAVLGGLGVFGGGLHNAMQYLGLQYTTATNGTLFFSLSPVTIMALAGLMLAERVRVMQWIGVAVSLMGVLVIALRGDPEALRTLSFNPGDLLCFGDHIAISAGGDTIVHATGRVGRVVEERIPDDLAARVLTVRRVYG